jgi:hypothetical protein
MADGLTVPFALAAGLSGVLVSTGIIVTAGLAEIVAGSIAMGLGFWLLNYLRFSAGSVKGMRNSDCLKTAFPIKSLIAPGMKSNQSMSKPKAN